HQPPATIAADRKPHPVSVQRRVIVIHSEPGRLVISAAIAYANGTVSPTKPRYMSRGWTAIIQWFCRSSLGPGPSSGGTGSTRNGLARKARTKKKNVWTACITASAHGLSGDSGAIAASNAVYPERSQAHSRMEPSRAAHIVTTFTQVGEAIRECAATYETLKSSVSRAVCMTTTPTEASRKPATADSRADVMRRASLRQAPIDPTTAP